MSHVFFELRKLLLCRSGLTVLAAIAAEIVLCLLPTDYEHPYSPPVYEQYTQQLAGEYTSEKYEYILSRLDEINGIIAEHDALEADYCADKITLEEFSVHNKEYTKAQAEQTTVSYLADKCNHFDRLGEGRFFNDTDWSDFFSHRGYAVTSVLLLLMLIPPVFCGEYTAKMSDVLRTAKHGRERLALTKIYLSAGVMFLLSLVMSDTEITVFFARHGTHDLTEPLQSIMGFEEYGSISVIDFFLRSTVMRACSFAVCASAVCLISAITNNLLFTVFLSFTVCVTPAMLSGGAVMCCILSPAVQNGMYPAGSSAAVFCLICIAKMVLYSVLCVRVFGKSR